MVFISVPSDWLHTNACLSSEGLLPIIVNKGIEDQATPQQGPPVGRLQWVREVLSSEPWRAHGDSLRARSAVYRQKQKGELLYSSRSGSSKGQNIRLRKKPQVQVLALPITQHVTWGKSVLASGRLINY